MPAEPLPARYPWPVATLSRRDVEHVAHLARLGLTEEEVKRMQAESVSQRTNFVGDGPEVFGHQGTIGIQAQCLGQQLVAGHRLPVTVARGW